MARAAARRRRRQAPLHGRPAACRGAAVLPARSRPARDRAREATSIKGAGRHARTVDVDELEPVDLVVAGCVAVDESGARLGKGGGFSDLELAVAAAAGLVDDHTVIATTVHELQVLPAGSVPTTDHDLHVDLVVTPDSVLRCPRPAGRARPALRWDELTDEKIAAIPLLQRLRPPAR